ncbi:hypothetical protein C2G38_2097568 [Gigaspora rosea]|uniref:Uncharacterized protein n=1 Tax=Gigaspora rosea TaxID=44941 RepID=A0A397UWL9_9GLOM|nr:hypothetical protein C2G38_2097568 [Gigaspora rosea]
MQHNLPQTSCLYLLNHEFLLHGKMNLNSNHLHLQPSHRRDAVTISYSTSKILNEIAIVNEMKYI